MYLPRSPYPCQYVLSAKCGCRYVTLLHALLFQIQTHDGSIFLSYRLWRHGMYVRPNTTGGP
jgi:hypothetical protein